MADKAGLLRGEPEIGQTISKFIRARIRHGLRWLKRLSRARRISPESNADRTESHFFNTDAFQVVNTPRFGTAQRMMVRQPGLWNLDFTVSKRFPIYERAGMVIRADAYNVLNHANWRTIDTTIRDVTNPNIGPAGTLKNPYGRVNAFGDPRELQMSLKLEF